MVTVQSISTSAKIVVISLWSQHIINLIVKALKAEGFSQLVSFGGMIEYNIKNYFDAIFVELTDQLFQLSSLTVMLRLGSIAGVWRKEVDRIVSDVYKRQAMVPLDEERVKREIDRFVEEFRIPVVTFTSDVEDTKRLCFVGQNGVQCGRAAAGLRCV